MSCHMIKPAVTQYAQRRPRIAKDWDSSDSDMTTDVQVDQSFMGAPVMLLVLFV